MYSSACVFLLLVLMVEATGKTATPEELLAKEEAKIRAKEAKKYNKYEAEPYVKRCPLGWSRLKNEKCFKLVLNATTHSEGEAVCKEHGSSLASIANENEKTYIQSLILKEVEDETTLTDLWVGLRRKANKLFWFDLTPLKDEGLPWATNQPSNAAGDDCGSIASDYETLVNATADFCHLKMTPCTELKGFVCQKVILEHCIAD